MFVLRLKQKSSCLYANFTLTNSDDGWDAGGGSSYGGKGGKYEGDSGGGGGGGSYGGKSVKYDDDVTWRCVRFYD